MRWGEEHLTSMGHEKYIIFFFGNPKGTDHLEEVGVDARIIFKRS
jgi:hypothetical protein